MALAATGMICALFLAGELLLGSHPRALLLWSDVFWTGTSLFAAVACARTMRCARTTHRRRAFFFFAFACFAWFLGMVFWDVDELVLGRVAPFPAPSDIGFLFLAPFFVPGFAFYGARVPSKGLTLKHLGDLGMWVSAFAFIAVMVYAHPGTAGRVPREGLMIAAGDAAAHLCALALGLLVYRQHVQDDRGGAWRWRNATTSNRRPLRILLLGLIVKSGITMVHGYALRTKTYQVGHELDVFGVLTFCLFAWAAYEETWMDEPDVWRA